MYFAKWLIRNKQELNDNYYYTSAIMRAYKNETLLREEQTREEIAIKDRHGDYNNFKNDFGEDFKELCSYVIKQNTNMASYQDYFNACSYLALDMNLDKNRYPHNFKRWHDIRTDEYATAKALKDEADRKQLYENFANIAEKYMPLQYEKQSVFIVIIPQSPSDLIREGELLHHCVGRMGYDQKMIREETLIFFIRKKECPDVPLVTVEYSPKTNQVLQCYGDHDSKPNGNIMNFVTKKWLPYVNQKLQQIAA